jgi:hypothetical protein
LRLDAKDNTTTESSQVTYTSITSKKPTPSISAARLGSAVFAVAAGLGSAVFAVAAGVGPAVSAAGC